MSTTTTTRPAGLSALERVWRAQEKCAAAAEAFKACLAAGAHAAERDAKRAAWMRAINALDKARR